MQLTGDQDVRIDFTRNPNVNQITGLDLDGDGLIENNGKENALNVKPTLGYGAVDAYTRLDNGVVNETNLSKVFLGDIDYDGTGFEGDGVKSDGNIVLGGLGADTILTGLGNDFIAAGGVALSREVGLDQVAGQDQVAAGRNSDFIFAELSLLSNTDGNRLFIDGGSTADNTSAATGQSAQDSDWLLLQASDDDEPVTVKLSEDDVEADIGDLLPRSSDGTVYTRAGQNATIRDIENVDASGNTYGFIKGLGTTLGGAPVNTNNNGIGSSGQLRLNGSEAANILIAGYDNDVVDGGAGNDIVMGGNLKSYTEDGTTVAHQILDANLAGLVGNNDGKDVLLGGDGSDNILFEADGGRIDGAFVVDSDDEEIDILWLTQNSLGAVVTASSVTPVEAAAATNPFTTDGVLRFDLAAGKEGGIDNYSGYGGAGDTDKPDSNASGTDEGFTADQTNYTDEAAHRVQVQDMESVIATGLGAIDYKAAGGNSATDVTFQNQQNFQAYNGDLDLRGTDGTVTVTSHDFVFVSQTYVDSDSGGGDPVTFSDTFGGVRTEQDAADLLEAANASAINALLNDIGNYGLDATDSEITLGGTSFTNVGGQNTLYAADGNDLLEGRTGNDLLSGGQGVDDFVFNLGVMGEDGGGNGDGLDVIWRQLDTDDNNLWDVNAAGKGDGAMARVGVSNQAGLMGEDFGKGAETNNAASYLSVDFTASDLAAANKYLAVFSVKIGTVTFAVTDVADVAELQAATSAAQVATVVNRVFNALDSHVTATASGNVVTIKDAPVTAAEGTAADGREMTNVAVTGVVTDPGQSFTNPIVDFTPGDAVVIEDRLIFAAYNNRADGELVDDDAVFGGDTLGGNNYAQDLVVGFGVDGSTIVAERQAFRVDLKNLAVQDKVTVTVNNVTYALQVGRELDHTLIPGETTEAFAVRLSEYINTFLDDDTAAGKVVSSYGANTDGNTNTGFFVLTQREYASEETVFMNVGVNVKDNSSNGEGALGTVTNLSSTDITLYQYNGRDGNLNAANVLFVGDSGVGPDDTIYSENSRSILETADNLKHADGTTNLDAGGYLLGSDAIVVNVTPDVDVVSSAAEGVGSVTVNKTTHVETLGTSEIFFNDAENPTTGRALNYAIHGDDQLIGGDATDIVRGGTGDDRVYGSLGSDRIDGGKDLWLVDGVIRVLNDYEAGVVDALPATLSIAQIDDGAFNDTLIYQQSDFGTVGATGATFNIALDLTAAQANGGAGRVITNGNAIANTTLFTNMENIRTVSGNGTLAGQGNDTLDLSITVNPLTGVTAPNSANMRYYLTKEANNGGEVHMVPTVAGDANDPADLGNPSTTLFTKVDGVENVLGGLGTDHLYIDQTESGKNNSFNASTSTIGVDADATALAAETAANGDKIFYENNATALTPAQLPKVVLAIGANDVDTVTMTNGMLPAGDAPVDTLTGVEFINIDAVARNADEADELNVSALTAGATVNFINGKVLNGANLVATVETGVKQFELVTGSIASDLVIIADDQAAGNSSADAHVAGEKILFDSYLSYDVVDDETDTTNVAPNFDTNDLLLDRMTVADMRAANTTNATNAIPDVTNTALYTYDLGAGAADRVDYSAETGTIAAVINLTTGNANKLAVLVDANDDGDIADATDRIDVLKGVEEIVAGIGESIIDLTSFGAASKITFQYTPPAVPAGDDVVEALVRIADSANNSIPGLANLVERFDNSTTGVIASWNRIEGSDFAETVTYDGSEDLINEAGLDHRYTDDTLTLRGGDNVVSYYLLETSIRAQIGVTADTGNGDGEISADVTFYDGLGTTAFLSGAQHTITSNSADNSIVGGTGTLKLEASQDKEDTVVFDPTSDKIFILGTSPGVLNVSLNGINNMVLTGFENLQDAKTNDVYDMKSLVNVSGQLTLLDDGPDHDTIKVYNDAADAAYGGSVTSISLAGLNTEFGFDFDVLDVTGLSGAAGLAVNAFAGTASADASDELVLGSVYANATTVTAFEGVVFTQAGVTANGGNFVYNTTPVNNTLTEGSKVLTDASGTLLTFSFRGEVLEAGTIDGGQVANVTSAINFSVTGAGTEDLTVYGGDGADIITGGSGDDTLVGGKGNDTLDGGFVPVVPEVVAVQFSTAPASDTWAIAGTATLFGVTVTNTSGVALSHAEILTAFDAVALATWQTAFNTGAAATAILSDVSVSGSQLVFSFTAASGDVDVYAGTFNLGTHDEVNLSGAGTVTSAEVAQGSLTTDAATNFIARGESADTFVFEATAALNGADTLNNVDAVNDTLDFDAFFGAAGTVAGASTNAGTTVIGLLDGRVNVAFNQSTVLTAADVSGLGVGDHAVVIMTGDNTGASGTVANDAYSVYFVEGTASGTETITLVGTVNSAAELTVAEVIGLI